MASKRRIARISHARPSFLEGVARVVDIGGTLNQYDADDLMRIHQALRARRLAGPSGIEAEAEAIKKVWVDVGGCIGDAIVSAHQRVIPAPVSGMGQALSRDPGNTGLDHGRI